MSAYFLFDNLEVLDPDTLQTYATEVAPMLARYGGCYRALGGVVEMLEGNWTPTYPVIIEFDSIADAKCWYESADYAPLKRMRQSAVRCNGVLIDGLGSG